MISVVICAESKDHVCSELRQSLRNQSVDHEIIDSFSPVRPERFQGMLQTKNEIVLFLDQDCELSTVDLLSDVVLFFNDNPKTHALLGFYESPAGLNLIARTYNKICKIWHFANPQKNLLGGCFALRNPKQLPASLWQVSDWGGEDAAMGHKLSALNLKSESAPWFWVYHHDRGSFVKFVSRAWVHGKARKKMSLKNVRRRNLLMTILKSLNLSELFVFALHIFVVEISALASGLKIPAISPKK